MPTFQDFRPEDGGSKLPRNIGIYLQVHRTQKTNIDMKINVEHHRIVLVWLLVPFYIPETKRLLSTSHFETIKDIQSNTTTVLKSHSENDFH
jgi:hypothetical protein